VPPTLADRVRHILRAIGEIESALAGFDLKQFEGDLLLRLAVERLLEIVCEASKYIPADTKAGEPDIPWQKIADFGNRLRHAYHSIDAAIVWQIATEDLEPLKNLVEQIVRDAGDGA
jgi:uncharacterized protein with HEPN domain